MLVSRVKLINSRKMADRVGFEPTIGVNLCRFSRPVLSTTQAPVRQVMNILIYLRFER